MESNEVLDIDSRFTDASGRDWVWIQSAARELKIPITALRDKGIFRRVVGRRMCRRRLMSGPKMGGRREFLLLSDIKEFARAREVAANDATLIRSTEIRKVYGLSQAFLNKYANKPCELLGGKALERIPQWRSYAGRLYSWVAFRKDQIQQIVRRMDEPMEKGWMSVAQAAEEFRFTRISLRRWAQHCPTLGRAIVSRQMWVRSAGRLQEVTVLKRADLETVHEKMSSMPTSHRDREGRTLIDIPDASRRYGITQKTIMNWYKRGARHMAGRKLEGTRQAAINSHGAIVRVVEEQVKEFADGMGGKKFPKTPPIVIGEKTYIPQYAAAGLLGCARNYVPKIATGVARLTRRSHNRKPSTFYLESDVLSLVAKRSGSSVAVNVRLEDEWRELPAVVKTIKADTDRLNHLGNIALRQGRRVATKADAINKAVSDLANKPASPPAPTKPKRTTGRTRGAKGAADREYRIELWEGWVRSRHHMDRKDYCDERDIDLKFLEKIQDWYHKQVKRGKISARQPL